MAVRSKLEPLPPPWPLPTARHLPRARASGARRFGGAEFRRFLVRDAGYAASRSCLTIAPVPCDHLISVRVDEDTKQRFRALAARERVTESALLKRLLEVALMGTRYSDAAAEPAWQETRAERLYVRLSRTDRRLLEERARGRDLRAATYVSLIVRAHLLDAAPLPKAELAALKHSIAELSAIGRNLNQFVRALPAGARATGFTTREAIALIKACELLRDRTKELVHANAASWRGGDQNG